MFCFEMCEINVIFEIELGEEYLWVRKLLFVVIVGFVWFYCFMVRCNMNLFVCFVVCFCMI